jgi:proteasome lid subunit RPN8/RPN11
MKVVIMDALNLVEAVYNEVIAHAREGKPQEVCGIMRGRDDLVFQLVRARNVAPDPVKDYVVDPQTLLRQFEFEEEGDAMVAIYHSHPVSPAYPSGSDAWSAYYPDCAYLICSLEDDEKPVVRAYNMLAHEVTLDIDQLFSNLGFDETRPGRFVYYQAADSPLPPVLQNCCAEIPMPFYIVFESSEESCKKPVSRVVSVVEREIKFVPD